MSLRAFLLAEGWSLLQEGATHVRTVATEMTEVYPEVLVLAPLRGRRMVLLRGVLVT